MVPTRSFSVACLIVAFGLLFLASSFVSAAEPGKGQVILVPEQGPQQVPVQAPVQKQAYQKSPTEGYRSGENYGERRVFRGRWRSGDGLFGGRFRGSCGLLGGCE